MTWMEFIKSRKRKAVLFFLTGFFSGGIVYFLCNEAAADAYEELWQNVKQWMQEEQPFFSSLMFALWKRGKVAGILFLAGNTRWNQNIFRAFVVWEGVKAGFFMTIFCFHMGIRGILGCVAMGIPHMFLFVPAYVIFMYGCLEKKRKYKKGITAVFFIMILAGCVVQAMAGQKVVHVLQSFTFW